MTYSKYSLLLLISGTLFFTACSRSEPKLPQPYKPLDLSHKSPEFRRGAHDGCVTAVEVYRKDHEAFNNYYDYNQGWWAGRRNCEGRGYVEF